MRNQFRALDPDRRVFFSSFFLVHNQMLCGATHCSSVQFVYTNDYMASSTATQWIKTHIKYFILFMKIQLRYYWAVQRTHLVRIIFLAHFICSYARLNRMKNARLRLKCVHVQSIASFVSCVYLCLCVCVHFLMNESVQFIFCSRISFVFRSLLFFFFTRKCLFTQNPFRFRTPFSFFFSFRQFLFMRGEHFV